MEQRTTLLTAIALLFALGLTTTAHADDSERWEPRLTVEAQLGGFSPVGVLGGIVGYAPDERVTLMAGGGLTLNLGLFDDADVSWRVAAGVRHRIVFTRANAFSMEYWASVGPWSDSPGSNNNRWDALVLVHVMPTWEYRGPTGFVFRMSLGFASNLYQRVSGERPDGTPRCDQCSSSGRRWTGGPSTSISFGYAF